MCVQGLIRPGRIPINGKDNFTFYKIKLPGQKIYPSWNNGMLVFWQRRIGALDEVIKTFLLRMNCQRLEKIISVYFGFQRTFTFFNGLQKKG